MTTTKLYAALAAAIAAMPDPKKNAKNDHFKNRYADLGAVLDCIEQPLRDNGLLLIQMPMLDSGVAILRTRLVCVVDGESLEFDYPLGADKPGPQAMGSAISYARRYTIKSLFGMVDVDDDGEAAEKRPAKKAEAAKPAAKQKPEDAFDLAEEAVAAMQGCTDMDQLLRCWKRAVASKFTGTDLEQITDVKNTMKDKFIAERDKEQE